MTLCVPGLGHPWVLDLTSVGVGAIWRPWVTPAPDLQFGVGFFSQPLISLSWCLLEAIQCLSQLLDVVRILKSWWLL
jgi:hypothetical protein